MCGRYTFTEKPDPNLVIQAPGQQISLSPRYNIAPSQMALVSPQKDPDHMYFYRWGLIPSWAKDPKIAFNLINARSETLWEKPAFRQSAKTSRCIVWGDGFYEWKKAGKQKEAFHIRLKEKGLFPMAGISASWTSGKGETIYSFSIITTEPNELMQGIHDRMPVILPADKVSSWLSPQAEKEELQILLRPFESELMEAYRVGPSVGNVRNDNPGLIQPFIPPPTLFG